MCIVHNILLKKSDFKPMILSMYSDITLNHECEADVGIPTSADFVFWPAVIRNMST